MREKERKDLRMLFGFLSAHGRIDVLSLELLDQVSMWFEVDFLLDGRSAVISVFDYLLDVR